MVSFRISAFFTKNIALLVLALVFFVGSSVSVFAAPGDSSGEGTGSGDYTDSSGEGTDGGSIQTVALQNPLNSINSIEELLEAILYIFMTLMIPVIVFFIILAGFKYVTAQGNASKVEEANRALLYAVIGGVLVLGAVAIASIIQSTVSAF